VRIATENTRERQRAPGNTPHADRQHRGQTGEDQPVHKCECQCAHVLLMCCSCVAHVLLMSHAHRRECHCARIKVSGMKDRKRADAARICLIGRTQVQPHTHMRANSACVLCERGHANTQRGSPTHRLTRRNRYCSNKHTHTHVAGYNWSPSYVTSS
jgi:hypothetical protein